MNKMIIRNLAAIFIALISTVALGQKSVEVPGNKRDSAFFERLPEKLEKYGLEDLSETEDSLLIRIWHSQQIIEVRAQGKTSHASLLHWINQQDPIIRKTEFGKKISQQLLDSLVAKNILGIPGDPYRGVDGSYVSIEIATPEHYRLYSYWSPWNSASSRSEGTKEVAEMVGLTNKLLDSNKHSSTFIASLEPGNYRWGMAQLRIDRFLPDDARKSSLYRTVAERVKKELKVTSETSPRNFPLIFIDQKPAFLRDLNHYENAEVKKLEIITAENPQQALYGTAGSNGIVLVETEQN